MTPDLFLFEIDLPASLNSSLLFSACADQDGAIFFDSSSSEHENSRFDIILSEPLSRFSHDEKSNQIECPTKALSCETNEDPFRVLSQLHKEFSPAKLIETDLPFIGGSAGWLSYDLGRSIEKIPTIAKNDIQIPLLKFGIYDWAIIKDNQTGKWFGVDYQPKLNRIGALIDKYKQSAQTHAEFKLVSDWQSNMTQSEYIDKFNTIKEYIENGDCYQINLAQRFSAKYTGSIWQAYLQLTEANKAPFSAYLRDSDFSILSISPERFLQLIDSEVETKPIKGTLPRGQSLKQDNAFKEKLQKSAKDRAENLMIVDLLRNDISRVCQAGTVRVPKLFEVESFPSVHHLVSTVTGKLKDNKDAFDLLRACFPGGSITGAPKIRAMEIIEELEPHRRSVYCGSIAYIDWRGNMDSSIAIRSLIAEQDNIHCWAGGGIVMDSVSKNEYQETLDKLNKILPVLKQ